MLTKWGYEIDAEALPPIVDETEFHIITAGKYAGDKRVPSQLEEASDAVRNHCGWHVSPSMPCACTMTVDGNIADLPLRDVTDVESVTDNGSAVPFQWRRIGQVRKTDGPFSGDWDSVVVRCTAGTKPDASLKGVVCKIAERGLSIAQGVSQESAGSVSVTYRADELSSREQMALSPYRVVM